MLRFTQRLPLVLGGLALLGTLTPTDVAAEAAATLTTELAAGLRPVSSQPIRQPSAAAILRGIERLAVVGNVLYVAAHPDDENTRLLSYLVGERQLRTAYLSLTRGDGGQNLIGAEQGPLLGLIRTQELLAARRVDGAEQWFTRARDFGYSKTPNETLSIWDRAKILSDVVLAIRRFRPDVILTRFSPGPSDTHGHHTSSAILAQEAFLRAADPTYEPDQVATYGAWATGRIYWNRSQWGRTSADELAGLPKLDIGGYDPVLGASFGEVAADSRSMHKSQGFGAAPTRSQSFEYFVALSPEKWPQKGTPGAGPLDGWDFSWGRVAGTARLRQLIEEARRGFDARQPTASLPALFAVRGELSRLPKNPYLAPKLAEVDDLIAACIGLWSEAITAEPTVAPGREVRLRVAALSRSSVPVRLRRLRLPTGMDVPLDRELPLGRLVEAEKTLLVPASQPVSAPYWLREPPEPGLYPASDPTLIGLPESPPAWSVELHFSIGPKDEPLVRRLPVLHKWTDPVAGERHRSLEITPSVMLNPEAATLMFADAEPKPLRVRLRAGAEAMSGIVQLELPPGFSAQPPSQPFSIAKKGGEAEIVFRLRPPKEASGGGTLRIVANTGDGLTSLGIQHIDYPHIPIQTLFPRAEVKLVRLDLKKTRTRIGYIPGAGDDVAAALRQVGYDVTILDGEALEGLQPNTGRFQAIVVGVRAYNTNSRLASFHPRLMEYVAAGGVLLAQYNTNNFLSQLSAPMGPYPFTISHDRVTDENATITVAPKHELWQRPNRLSDADLAGWVQERGLYFAGTWDAHYETPLSMNDPGESPKSGSVLIARHGKGVFIYTGLAFFRQLPAGVAGAYRLFGNLLDYGTR